MQKIKFFVMLFWLASFAWVGQAADFGGLYFSPETKQAIYLDWNAEKGHVNAVYVSENGSPHRRFEIMTQTPKTSSQYAFAYYIQIWEPSKPNVSYELNLGIEVVDDPPLLYLNKKRSQERTRLARLGNTGPQRDLSSDEDAYLPLSHSLVQALSNMTWWYFDTEDSQIHADVAVDVMAGHQSNELAISLKDGDMNLSISIEIDDQLGFSLTVHADDMDADELEGLNYVFNKASIELGDDVQWQIYFYDKGGEPVIILMQSI
ncbi:MAG: hypothetical protein ACFCUI_08525 [Bernardetiaceae bacterium]